MSPLTIALATLVSEDLTCVAVGLLIGQGRLDAATGLLGCYVGIVVGDIGLWLIGRLAARGLLRWRAVERRLPRHRLESLSRWFSARGWQAVLVARFLPGARFPVYVGAGLLGADAARFALWSALACLLWTPLLVGVVAIVGEPVIEPLRYVFGHGWAAVLATAVLFVIVLRAASGLATRAGRARMRTRVERIWRWEFWPAWLFYFPVLPWLAYLSLRHRGLTTVTAANPGIPHGGIVGESKYDILRRLPSEWIVPTRRLDPGPLRDRLDRLNNEMVPGGWTFPLILKPDVGERGAGVRLVRTWDAAAEYLRNNPGAVLAQVYHPGPHEAGVFYYRLPGEPQGRILSITDKQFPVVIGDGVSSVESLIFRHPRFHMQANTFLARLNGQAGKVLAAGEPLRLAVAGNHCQGTLFRDGAHLWTPQLGQRIDEIATTFEGFFFGRFDIRYADAADFRAGRNFAIVELNGASSESTNLYDPSRSLFSAYGILFRQWNILFQIGARNRARGHATTPLAELARVVRSHYRDRTASALAD